MEAAERKKRDVEDQDKDGDVCDSQVGVLRAGEGSRAADSLLEMIVRLCSTLHWARESLTCAIEVGTSPQFDHVAAAIKPQRKFRGVGNTIRTSTPRSMLMSMYTLPTRKIGPMAFAFSGVIEGTIFEKRRAGSMQFKISWEAPRLAGTGKSPARVRQQPIAAGMACRRLSSVEVSLKMIR